MSQDISNKKRIAKNTVMLYIRMLLSTIVSLYTSRVVLQTLGVEDFGIYGVVGGVVSMFSFLNSAMSGATSRFLTFEIGKQNNTSQNLAQASLTPLQKTFSSAMIIHVCIAIIVSILSCTIGLWFLSHKLVIPENRMIAAYWVFLCSILGMFVNVTQVPYTAAIIAHEKLDVYAYVEIINVFLKLGIVYLLVIGQFDKLILYAILSLVVNIIIVLIYRVYCLKSYDETHFHWVVDKPLLKSITSFSAYNLFSNFGWVVNNQGTNFLINMFFGVSLNAASSIANTISGVVNGFAANIMTAFRPPITKAYASGDTTNFESLINWAIKIILIIYSLVAIPVILTMDRLLQLWLVEVPPFAGTFCQLMLISLYGEIFKQLIVIGIHASGRVRSSSIMSSIMYCVNPLIIYICFRFHLPASSAYISAIFMHLLIGLIDTFILKQKVRSINVNSFLKSFASVVIVVIVSVLLYSMTPDVRVDNVLLSIAIDSLKIIFILMCLSYVIVLDSQQRKHIHCIIKNKLFHHLSK